jgi:hypothetical protein
MNESDNNTIPDGLQPKNRNWIWLFVVMFTLAALAAGINLTFNLRQQLTLEQITKAKATWEHFGPDDYDLIVRKDVTVAGPEHGINDVLKVQVRKRTVTDFQFNGKPHEDRRLWSHYDMAGLFDWIERFAEMDAQPKAPRTFCVGFFDLEDGHIIKYIRSVSGTGDRQELNIEFKKVAP